MKRLIVCCDGTWNRADQVRDGVATPTNVVKVHKALGDRDREGNPQVAHYVEGVGTKRWERVRGGGLGVGLSRNVQDVYRFLVDRYEPGDRLYFFGFSRGAFTARSAVGLVRNSGILRREHADRIKEAYRLYRSRKPGDAPKGDAAERFRGDYSHPSCEIEFVGVWDTVGALGIPIDGIRPPLLSRLWTFHDTTLSSAVRHAYHAVSIDERRGPFKPTLWVKAKDDGPAEDQTVEQVWFAGVHSDVGGGYPDPSLSEIPLRWMVEKATSCGLAFTTDRLLLKREGFDDQRRCLGIELAPNPCGEIHDSLSLLYRLMRRHDRRLRAHEGEAVAPWLSSSARTRYDTDRAYRPLGWDDWVAGHPEDMQVPN
jgi:uncharacterized protein (DUF2235 family)